MPTSARIAFIGCASPASKETKTTKQSYVNEMKNGRKRDTKGGIKSDAKSGAKSGTYKTREKGNGKLIK